MVEFLAGVEPKKLEFKVPATTVPHAYLNNIYNNCITGPHFCSVTYTRVSYHNKAPSMNDEIKIRLPDILTGRHWVKFTLQHIHVKQPVAKQSILSSLIRTNNDKTEADIIDIGVAMLPLMANNAAILEDGDHLIQFQLGGERNRDSDVSASSGTEYIPTLKVRTRAYTSFVSSDPLVENSFKMQPMPLGYLPSSIMTRTTAQSLRDHGEQYAPNEAKFVNSAKDLIKASPLEVVRHFLVLMRQMQRAMVAGTGIYDESYINPFKHFNGRCQAFLTMLQLFGKLAPDMSVPSSSASHYSKEKDFLKAYVDFVFDEEVPIDGDDAAPLSPSKTIFTASRFSSDAEQNEITSPNRVPNHSQSAKQFRAESLIPDEDNERMSLRPLSTPVVYGSHKDSFAKSTLRPIARSSDSKDADVSERVERLRSESPRIPSVSVEPTQSYIDAPDEELSSNNSSRRASGTCEEIVEDPKAAYSRLLKERMHRRKSGDSVVKFANTDGPVNEVDTSTSIPSDNKNDRLISSSPEMISLILQNKLEQSSGFDRVGSLRSATNDSALDFGVSLAGSVDLSEASEAHISADTEREYIPELESVSSSLSDNVEEEESARNENDPLSWVSSIDYSESDAESKNKGCSDDEVDNEAGKRSSYYRRQLSHISEASVGSVAIDDTNLEEVDEGLKDDSNNDLRSVHISSSMEGIDNLNSRDVPHQSVCEDQFEDNDEFDQVENAEVIVEAGMELSMEQDEKMQNMFDQGIAASAESFQSEESRIDRDSWGSFVTDSRWSTNNLTSVKHALDGTNSAGKKYVEDIALHVVLQAERIILERQFNVAILAISAEILCNSDHFSGDDRFLSESQIMAGKRFRTNRELLQMPFEDEKSWFSSIDTGKTVNEMDIIVGRSDDDNDQAIDRSSKDSDEVELPKNIQESHITNRKSIRVVLEGTKEIAPPASGDALLIQPSLPLFDTILGYRDRVSAITSFQNKHWWPWMYEVLVFQWGAVLAITLSSSSLISTANLDSIVGSYPFEYDLTHSGTAHMRSGWKDTRNLLMDHGPVLLKMIYKSLVLRIKRERKITPVLLDDQFLNALDNLIMLIALEMATFSSGLWLSRILNKAVAAFLKAMFAVASSNQVLRLIRSYFRALRGKHRVDETELRLQMMEELAQFDYSVALNFPLVLDAPFSVFGHNAVNPEYSVNKILFKSYTSYGIRGSTNPPPYLFAHLLVSEIMATYRQEERKTKDVALEILRDMIVRHVYDARYQDQNSQQRVACMYLPLIKEVLKECNKLEKIRHDATERKELLALLLYVLQGIPEHLLRNRLRILCAQTFAVREDLTGYPISSDARPASVMHYEPESERKSSVMPRVVSMRHSNDGRMPSRLSFFRKHVEEVNHVRNLIITMHLILDTFEFPNYSSNTSSTSVEASLVLAPSITVNHLDDTRLDDPNTSQFSSVRRNPSGAGDGTPKWSLATNRLASLDHRMQTRKMTASTTRKSLPQNKGEERKWISHVQRMHTRKEFEVSTQSVSRTTMIYASRQLCYASTISVIEVLLVMIEEVPKIIVNTPLTRQSANTYTLRDTNIDESILTGILDIRIIDFIRMCSSVILHALYCHQEDPAIVKLLSLAKIIVKRFGAKIFLGAVEDSLQDWMRSVLYHCASQYKVVRNSASNFLLFLLRSSFNYLGSLTLIVNTVLAIMNDVIEGILDANKAVVKTHADEDRIVGYLNISIVNMKDAVRRNSFNSSMHVAFAQAVVTFMNSLEVILLANSDIRRYVSHPVGYDFLGANLLDGPFNERTSLLVQTLRQRRKEVQRDAADSNKSGFQIEEVMMHFVRAAEVYDPIKLPRFRMQWLENLARLHELRQNRAEGAEIRWKIFQLCQLVEHTWHNQWSPRPPLEWIRRTVDSNYYQNHSVVSASMSTAAGVNRRRSDGTDFSTKTTTSSSSPADTDSGRFSTKILPDRNFYAVMAAALDGRPHRSWFDQTQYLQHMETSLSVATERFCAISLVNLAERSSFHLIRLYRLSRKTESMAAEYARISNAVKTMIERGITTNMAIGKFYRVSYEGAGNYNCVLIKIILLIIFLFVLPEGVPENLRTKEFIFRNATHLHVSEFQTLVVNHLKSVVEEGVVVKTVQDISSVKNAMEDANIAYIVMNSVKPIMKHNKLLTRAYHRSNNDYLTQHNYSSHEQDVDMEGMNRVSSFQYSVPFTSDPKRSHAKKIDDQWMRSTILTVKEPFPYIITRQEVYRRDNRDYSPIEVAINDIEERIETMESELEKEIRNPSDCNDLMRIIQGTVMPQVFIFLSMSILLQITICVSN